jgi:hypothetical protein
VGAGGDDPSVEGINEVGDFARCITRHPC